MVKTKEWNIWISDFSVILRDDKFQESEEEQHKLWQTWGLWCTLIKFSKQRTFPGMYQSSKLQATEANPG